jgi:hypothetical protein
VSTQWLSSSKWLARGGRRSRCVHFCAMHSRCLPKIVLTSNTPKHTATHRNTLHHVAKHCSTLWRWSMLCVAVCCSALQRVATCCSVLQQVAACCSVLQLHCVALYCLWGTFCSGITTANFQLLTKPNGKCGVSYIESGRFRALPLALRAPHLAFLASFSTQFVVTHSLL